MPSQLILLADDSSISLAIIKKHLENLLPEDFILVTSHPAIIVDILLENSARCVFTDLMFFDPTKTCQLQMQGTDLIKMIRSFELDSNSDRLPIIAFSGDASKRGEAFSAGCDYFISKPVNAQSLRAALVALGVII
jgi:CheY-like chemotaxis protein